jgi:hypothetical protein
VGIWDSSDANASLESGSVTMTDTNTGGSPLRLRQCVPVAPGTDYLLAHNYFIPTGQPNTPTAQLTLSWHSGPGCTSSLGSGNIHSGSFVGRWEASPLIATTSPPTAGSAEIYVEAVAQGLGGPVRSYFDNVLLAPATGCVTFGSTLCLNNERFRVTASWRDFNGNVGAGQARKLAEDSGSFWFFSNTNLELTIKVLDACVTPFDRYWVFISGLTNVEVEITVEDTLTNFVNTYFNPLGESFETILDTDAFATCP